MKYLFAFAITSAFMLIGFYTQFHPLVYFVVCLLLSALFVADDPIILGKKDLIHENRYLRNELKMRRKREEMEVEHDQY